MMVTRAEYLPTEIIEANDGSEDLAAEIKLTGVQSTEKGTSTGSKISRKEKAETEKVAPKSKEPIKSEATEEEVVEEVAEEVAES